MTAISLRGIQFSVPTWPDGFTSQAFPVSGTLYNAPADGVYVLDVDQPTSPNYLDRIELWVRAQAVDATNTYLLDDGWLLRLEFQSDSTWDAKAGSVSSGTENFNFTAADVGASVTALAWDVSGSTLKAFYSTTADPAYPADFTQIGSDITSALYQSVAAVGASYNGATGSELLTNNDFSTWTGTPTTDTPDGWLTTETATDYVTQDANGALVNSPSAGSDRPLVRQTITSARKIVVYDIFSVTSGNAWVLPLRNLGNSPVISAIETTDTTIGLYGQVGSNVYVAASVSARVQAALDNGSDGALNLEKVS